jgi:hypothetical protein
VGVTIDPPRTIPNEDIPLYCPRAGEVQAAVDRVMARIGPRPDDETPWGYGTRAHNALAAEIRRINDGRLGEGSLRAEVAHHKGPHDTSPDAPNLIRTDVLEHGRNNTVCVYDLKTGREPLWPRRAVELGRYAVSVHRDIRQVVVTEVRPTP